MYIGTMYIGTYVHVPEHTKIHVFENVHFELKIHFFLKMPRRKWSVSVANEYFAPKTIFEVTILAKNAISESSVAVKIRHNLFSLNNGRIRPSNDQFYIKVVVFFRF